MTETNRVLNLDEETQIEVRLGNETYFLRQQRRAVLDKVLRGIYPDKKADPALSEKATMRELVEFSSQSWEESFPIFALILGVEETDANYKEMLKRLEEHLTFPKARAIFEAWWELNRVEDFFYFGGNPLIPESRLRTFLEQKNGQTTPEEAVASVN